MKPIRVMVVDDSAVMRQVLSEVLAREHDIEVVATASDPLFAREKMARDWPDVLVLDIEMPRMDGITFLRALMVERPTPVVICSTLTERGANATMQALAAGAVEVVLKPTVGLREFLTQDSGIPDAVRAAARAGVSRTGPAWPSAATSSTAGSAPLRPAVATPVATVAHPVQVIAMGASTGGTQALEAVLTGLPPGCAGIVIVQHMPERFTAAFASRLHALSQIEVREARHGDAVRPGLALIAPGGRQMELVRSGSGYAVDVTDGPPVNRHRPSVDVLFESTARVAGRHALGVIMTGMGNDGARGLLRMREAGAITLAQDEASCVVYGMPREAVKLGAVQHILGLPAITRELGSHATG